jgi:hypothetical protein
MTYPVTVKPGTGSALAVGANSASIATGANISQRLAEKCCDLIGCQT